MESSPVTVLIERVEEGDSAASEELYALVYGELRAKARALLGRGANTLQPTALVHEAWLKLAGPAGSGLSGRVHFFALAAKAMRSVLIDHARAKDAVKRPGDAQRLVLDEVLAVYTARVPDLLALEEALAELERLDPELSRVVELRFFSGLTIPETAEVMQVGTATVERSWRSARAFLSARLDADAAE